MIKLLQLVGARPQIIKAAALSRAIRNLFPNKINEVIVHTGQHYDKLMSQVFFDELQLPTPHYNLNIGSDTHGKQTAAMIVGIEEILLKEKPNAIILYGDTNSTLAGAIAAAKIHIPIVHIEAGLRSFNKSMPEEINRIICDKLSTLLFSPTKAGITNLLNEGFTETNVEPFTIDNPKMYHCGDIMYDNSTFYSEIAEQKTTILQQLNLINNEYVVVTIHRNNNTDDALRFNAILNALQTITKQNNIQLVFPLHPRTEKLLNESSMKTVYESLKKNSFIKLIPPVTFLEMLLLEKHAKLIITDSGGVQKEAHFFHKPCIVLRPETEWVELVENGTAKICDADESKILAAYNYFLHAQNLKYPNFFGDGKAAEFICSEICKYIVN